MMSKGRGRRFGVLVWTTSIQMPIRQREVSRSNLALSFEFRGEVWAGDSNVEVTNTGTESHKSQAYLETLWSCFAF